MNLEDEIKITLRATTDGGFEWKNVITGDDILHQVGDTDFVVGFCPEGTDGCPVNQTFVFKALKAGPGVIKLIYGRPWIDEVEDQFEVIDGKLLKDKFIWSLMVAFHEQFHVLYYSEASQPAWAGESLAQYYAIKILEKVGFDPKLLRPIKGRFIQPSRKIEMGLKEANHKFKTQNDMSVFHLFYDQGATFWSELDRLILDSTRNKKSLDDFLGELSKMNFAQHGSIPEAFINRLMSNNVNGIESLIEKYL